MSRRTPLHLFAAPPAIVEEARKKLTRGSCPRRYCFHWNSQGFHWEQSPEEGCYLMNPELGSMLTRHGPWRCCRRATRNPHHPDYYEPNQAYLRADGWRDDYFTIGLSRQARQQRYIRRQKGVQCEQIRQEAKDDDDLRDANRVGKRRRGRREG